MASVHESARIPITFLVVPTEHDYIKQHAPSQHITKEQLHYRHQQFIRREHAYLPINTSEITYTAKTYARVIENLSAHLEPIIFDGKIYNTYSLTYHLKGDRGILAFTRLCPGGERLLIDWKMAEGIQLRVWIELQRAITSALYSTLAVYGLFPEQRTPGSAHENALGESVRQSIIREMQRPVPEHVTVNEENAWLVSSRFPNANVDMGPPPADWVPPSP